MKSQYLELKLWDLMNSRPDQLKGKPEDVYLSMPLEVWQVLNHYMQQQMLKDYIANHLLQRFMGYRIVPGYEKKLVLYHKDYALNPTRGFKHEVNI